MNRRNSVVALGALTVGAISSCARAQARPRKPPARVALLDDAVEAARAHLWKHFRARLDRLASSDDREIIYDQRWAGGNPEKLAALAAELVARNPDVLVAVTTTAALAARNATTSIPIVAIGPSDPVKSGLVASLARPGGNVTGVSPNQAEIAGKWLEIVREIVPSAKSLAYLTDVGNPGEMLVFRQLEARARPLALKVRAMDGHTPSDVDQSFASIERERIDALIVSTTASLLPYRDRIVQSATRLRLPTVYARAEYPEAGGLLSYGTEGGTVFGRAAEYVDRILKGARPAELPFEMASTFTLVLNTRAASAIGVDIPARVLARADRIVQ